MPFDSTRWNDPRPERPERLPRRDNLRGQWQAANAHANSLREETARLKEGADRLRDETELLDRITRDGFAQLLEAVKALRSSIREA